MSERAYYEQASLWGREPEGPEVERVDHTVALVPSDVRTVLDVGCGDGRLANRIAATGRTVVGLDMSREALRHVCAPRVLGACDRLPFADRSFDLVLCCEVLEHLPVAVYRATLAELGRVASHYAIISTPFRERLQERFTRCEVCGTTYHIYHHVRSFEMATFEGLLPGLTVAARNLCGDRRVARSGFELWLKQNVGGCYPQPPSAICPACQNHGSGRMRWTLPGLVAEGAYRVRQRVARPTPHWVIVLLSRRGPSPGCLADRTQG